MVLKRAFLGFLLFSGASERTTRVATQPWRPPQNATQSSSGIADRPAPERRDRKYGKNRLAGIRDSGLQSVAATVWFRQSFDSVAWKK